MATAEELAAANERALANLAFQKETQERSLAHTVLMHKRTSYQSYLTLAHASLAEQKRNLPTDQRTITPQEIIDFANELRDAAEENALG